MSAETYEWRTSTLRNRGCNSAAPHCAKAALYHEYRSIALCYYDLCCIEIILIFGVEEMTPAALSTM